MLERSSNPPQAGTDHDEREALIAEARRWPNGSLSSPNPAAAPGDLITRLVAALEASHPSPATVEAVTTFILAADVIPMSTGAWTHLSRDSAHALAEGLVARFTFPAPVVTEGAVALTDDERMQVSAVVHQGYYMPDVFATVERIIAGRLAR